MSTEIPTTVTVVPSAEEGAGEAEAEVPPPPAGEEGEDAVDGEGGGEGDEEAAPLETIAVPKASSESIAEKGAEQIGEGETILVYSLTDAIYETFRVAGSLGRSFKLIIPVTKADSYLTQYNRIRESVGLDVFGDLVSVSCVNFSGIMSFMTQVDKVFIGGHAMFTTGGVMARAGASTVALCASQNNIPVIFFCEISKFCDESPTDVFYAEVFPENKYGSRDCLTLEDADGKKKHYDIEELYSAKISYDLTPSTLVTCVITDIDMLPSSSVPVVLRVQETRPLCKM